MIKRLLLLTTLLLATALHAEELKPYSGDALPPFTLSGMEGSAYSLDGEKGKVVLVNFWATYCGPCIKEMPSMVRLKERMAGRPFEILAINMAETKEDVAGFLQHIKLETNFPILLDPEGGVIEGWMISAVPTTFILDREGAIRYARYGAIEWDGAEVIDTIEALLK